MKTAYLAGPMRGMPQFNFPTFVRVTAILREQGWSIISPVELDKAAGVTPEVFGCDNASRGSFDEEDEEHREILLGCMKRDVKVIIEDADAIIMLPGWRNSTGATSEYWLARWKHIPAYEWDDIDRCAYLIEKDKKPYGMPAPPDEEENILEKANEITHHDRRKTYGHPVDNFSHIAEMWAAYLNADIRPEDVAPLMIMVKLSRESHCPKQDNWTDIAGYAWCGDEVRKQTEQGKHGKA